MPEVPDCYRQQLKQSGHLVAVVGAGNHAEARLLERAGSSWSSRRLFSAVAPPLPGFATAQVFQF